jgi:hypothetical protein
MFANLLHLMPQAFIASEADGFWSGLAIQNLEVIPVSEAAQFE